MADPEVPAPDTPRPAADRPLPRRRPAAGDGWAWGLLQAETAGGPAATRWTVAAATLPVALVAALVTWGGYRCGAAWDPGWTVFLATLGVVPVALIPQIAPGVPPRRLPWLAVGFASCVGWLTGSAFALVGQLLVPVVAAQSLVVLGCGIAVVVGLGALGLLQGGSWGRTLLAVCATLAVAAGLGALAGHSWVIPFVREHGVFARLAEDPGEVGWSEGSMFDRVGAAGFMSIAVVGGIRCAVGDWAGIEGRLRGGMPRAASVGAGAVMLAAPATLVIATLIAAGSRRREPGGTD
jgi:hypothetical protein